ncbi:hypothetical protein BJ508DRAFT_333186 [Ascobolus immersus RN42]|uniref:Uncharacterized protein n=1 Tax=Ascobolus immersus RN42 TaxID=1160509 RepID=A0A3N4HKF0_ASCIM|nr:hypothetical protein BJ508DRAFT_333186 [Ascobolus immersus RN42]
MFSTSSRMSENHFKSRPSTGPSSMADDEESNRSLGFRSDCDSDEDDFVDAFDTLEPGMVTPARQRGNFVYKGPVSSRRNSVTDNTTETESSFLNESDDNSSEAFVRSGHQLQNRGPVAHSRNHTAEKATNGRPLRELGQENAGKGSGPFRHISNGDLQYDRADAKARQGLDLDKATQKLKQLNVSSLNAQQAVEEKKAPLKPTQLPKLSWEIECEKARKKKLREDRKKCPWGSAWSIGGSEPVGFVDPNASGYFGLPEANRSSVLFPTGEVLTEEEIQAREERKKDDQEIKSNLSAAQYHREMIFAAAKHQVRAKSKKDKGKAVPPPVNPTPGSASLATGPIRRDADMPQHPNLKPLPKPVSKPASPAVATKAVPAASPKTPLATPALAKVAPIVPVAPVAHRQSISSTSSRGGPPPPLIKIGSGRLQNAYGKLPGGGTSRLSETDEGQSSDDRKAKRFFRVTQMAETEPVSVVEIRPAQENKDVVRPTTAIVSTTHDSGMPEPMKPVIQQVSEGTGNAKVTSPQHEVPTVFVARDESLPSSLSTAPAASSSFPPSFQEQPPSKVQTLPQNGKFSPSPNKDPSTILNTNTNSLSGTNLSANLSALYTSDAALSVAQLDQTVIRRPGWNNPNLLRDHFQRRKMASLSVPSPLDSFCSKNADAIDDELMKHIAIVKAAGKDFKETNLYKVEPPVEYVPTYEESLVEGPLPICGNRIIKIDHLPAGYSLSYVSDTILRGATGPIQYLHLDKAHNVLYVVFLEVQTAIHFMQGAQEQGGYIDIGEKWWVQPQYFPLFDAPQMDLYRYAKLYKASRVVVIGNVRVVQLVKLLERLTTGWHMSKLTIEERCDRPNDVLKFIGKEFGIGAIVLTSMMAAFNMYNFLSEVEKATSILKDAYINFGVDPACSPRKINGPYTYSDGRVPGITTSAELARKAELKAERAKQVPATR